MTSWMPACPSITAAIVYRMNAGRIAGAISIPFPSVANKAKKLTPHEVLQKQFAETGITPSYTVIVYCHIGQQASLVYFVSSYVG